jgi:regulatory protein
LRQQTLYGRAVGLLARREHSAYELKQKLAKAEVSIDEVIDVIEQLQRAGLQSDLRFAENYVRYRSQRGNGPLRIKQELNERGVASDITENQLNQIEIDWYELANNVRCKRFGEASPTDFKERAKQQRFLQYRGFSHDHINESLNRHDEK